MELTPPPGIADDAPPGSIERARIAVESVVASAILGRPGVLRRWLARRRRETVDGRVLDEQVAAMLGLDDISKTSNLLGLEPPQARRRVAESVGVVDGPASPEVSTEDVVFDQSGHTVSFRCYRPPSLASPAPALVFVHGGGWVTGSVTTHDALCRRLALDVGMVVASVRYRLAPEHRFPTAVDDCLNAVDAISERADELGIDADRIAVGGDSAGGNLSAVIARRRAGERAPALQVLLYPALDATCSLPSHRSMGGEYFLTSDMIAWYYDHYLGGADPQQPDASPGLTPPPVGTARAIVVAAGFDPLRDEAERYAGLLEDSGVDVVYRCFDELPHGFALMTGAVDRARIAMDRVASDIRERL